MRIKTYYKNFYPLFVTLSLNSKFLRVFNLFHYITNRKNTYETNF